MAQADRRQLGSAAHTTKAHRAELMRKFEVVSLAELVRATELLRPTKASIDYQE